MCVCVGVCVCVGLFVWFCVPVRERGEGRGELFIHFVVDGSGDIIVTVGLAAISPALDVRDNLVLQDYSLFLLTFSCRC